MNMSLPQRALDRALRLLWASRATASGAEGPGGEAEGKREREATAVVDAYGCYHPHPPRSFESLLQQDNRVSLVDSSLAMLGFSRTTLHDALHSTLLRTLIALLRSSIASGSHSFAAHLEAAFSAKVECDKIYYAGCSPSTVWQIVDNSIRFLEMTQPEEHLVLELLEVLVEISSMVSSFEASIFSSCMFYERENQNAAIQTANTVSSITAAIIRFSQGRKQAVYNHFRPHIRLLLWRLQPQLLSQDLSTLLQKVMDRPLLALKEELRCVHEWHTFVIALAFGPDAFEEARSTLNAWLLASGWPCIWELKAELGAAVRDLLEDPCSWDLLLDVGTNLPSLTSFYPISLLSSIKVLIMPPSLSGLCDLVSMCEQEPQNQDSCRFEEQSSASLWLLLMDFPNWIHFACLLLFQSPGSQSSVSGTQNARHIVSPCIKGSSGGLKLQEVSAKYIAWVFCPYDQEYRELVITMLVDAANCWLNIGNKEGVRIKSRDENHAKKRQKLPDGSMDTLAIRENGSRSTGWDAFHKSEKCFSSKDRGDHAHESCEGIIEEVMVWLVNFESSCRYLDSYKCWGSSTVKLQQTGTARNAKRRLTMDAHGSVSVVAERGCIDDMDKESSTTAVSSQPLVSTFLDTLPLMALVSSAWLHKTAAVHLIIHSVISIHKLSSHKINEQGKVRLGFVAEGYDKRLYQELAFNVNGQSFREPSHRTEDFKDVCSSFVCSDPSFHRDWAFGMATIFTFLDSIELLQSSDALNLECLAECKEMVSKQLMVCIRGWSQQVGAQHLMLLDDLRHRVSLWVTKAKLQTDTHTVVEQVLQGLDIIIASSIVDP